MRLVSCLIMLAIAGCSGESTNSAAQVADAKGQAVADTPAAKAVEVGSVAPEFELPGSDGQTHKLSDYAGQHVVVAFFPKAFTGGWTLQCKALRDSDQEIQKFNVSYFMASTDTLEDNTAFATKNDASFPILADAAKGVSAAYGVLGASGFAGRVTFYIDPAGKVARIDRQVNPRTAGADLLVALQDLAVPLR